MRVFFSDRDLSAYLELVKEEAGQHRVEIFAWCLMTNHVHLVAVAEDNPYGQTMR